MALGLLIGEATGAATPWMFFVGAAGAAAIALTSRPIVAHGALAVGAALLGVGWWAHRIETTPRDALARSIEHGALIVRVEGLVASRPDAAAGGAGRLGRFARFQPPRSCEFRILRAQDRDGSWSSATGLAWLQLPAGVDVEMGDALRLEGRAAPVAEDLNPGPRRRVEWSRQRGVAGSIDVPAPGLIERLSNDELDRFTRARSSILRWTGRVRDRALAWSDGAADSPGQALMGAMLLGERELGLDEVRESFTNVGMAHILAISGMHLTILAWTATLGLRALGEPGRWEAPIVLVAVLVYIAIVPAGAPIIRAAIMTVGMLIAESAGRRYDRLNTLGWTMLAVLLWRPLELWSAGFQLSFACVGALLWLAPILRERWFGEAPDPDQHRLLGRLTHRVRDALGASVAAWIVSAPIVAFHFGIVTLLAAPASVLALPLATAGIAVGYAAVLVGALLPWLDGVVGPLVGATGGALAWIASALDAIPGGTLRLPPLSVATTVAGAIIAVWWLRKGGSRSAAGRVRAAGALALLSSMIWIDARRAALPSDVLLRMDTLAVGDGTCHIVRSGRETLLWDCGSSNPGVGVRTIPQAARSVGAWRVRTVVITHPNLDHFAGLLDIAAPLGVRRVVVGESFIAAADEREGGPEATALRWLGSRGVGVDVVSAGDTITLGDATIEFISPERGEAFEDVNDTSLVARIVVRTEIGERRALLTGDIERPAMRAILERVADVWTDLLEAPHHGSAAGGAPEFFVDAVAPRLIVQSTGPGRVGDERWNAAKVGRVWWTTATDGAVRTEFRRDGAIQSSDHRGEREFYWAPSVPVPAKDTVGRLRPESNRISAIAPGARYTAVPARRYSEPSSEPVASEEGTTAGSRNR